MPRRCQLQQRLPHHRRQPRRHRRGAAGAGLWAQRRRRCRQRLRAARRLVRLRFREWYSHWPSALRVLRMLFVLSAHAHKGIHEYTSPTYSWVQLQAMCDVLPTPRHPCSLRQLAGTTGTST